MKFNGEINSFIRDFVKDLSENNAAIFAGAGLSKSSGYVNWKELLTDIAEELELKIDLESDLISLAQYHVCLLYTSPSPRDVEESRMPSSA